MSWLPDSPEELFGQGARETEAFGLLTVDVPAERWVPALRAARDDLGCTYFDWLSAVDEPDAGFLVCAHVVALGGPPRRLMLRTEVPRDAPALPTATDVYAGAAWHERETHEMFGVEFPGHPGLEPLLLPESFEGHPLRKDFVLASRVVKAWPGAKEPGEPAHGGPRRRQMLPPGVPDPNEWGPLKGQVPPAAPTRAGRARPARGGDRAQRRSRSAGEGSATQRRAADGPGAGPEAEAESPGAGSDAGQRPPRRSQSAAEGSASQRRPDRPGPRPDTGTAAGHDRGTGQEPAGARDGAEPAERGAASRARSADAPWRRAPQEAEDSRGGTDEDEDGTHRSSPGRRRRRSDRPDGTGRGEAAGSPESGSAESGSAGTGAGAAGDAGGDTQGGGTAKGGDRREGEG